VVGRPNNISADLYFIACHVTGTSTVHSSHNGISSSKLAVQTVRIFIIIIIIIIIIMLMKD
jgi:flagellar biogenesis protein FliO